LSSLLHILGLLQNDKFHVILNEAQRAK